MELEASGLHGEQNPLYTELKQRLIKMTATSDPQERLAATALLSALANVDTLEESQMMRITTQTKTLMQGSDTTVCAEAMAIYRRLIQNRWVTVLSTVEMDVSRRLELLDGERSDVQRLMTLRLIEMLCSENLIPLYSYVSKIFARLSHPLRDQRIEIRTAAGRALGACLGLVPLTERNPRNTWLNFLFEEMRLNQQLGTVEALHGSLLICQELLQHGGMYMQSHFAQACETAMRLKDNRDAFVRRAAIEQLPMLARYSPQEFARVGASGESMLSRSCNYLITLSRTNDSERPTTLLALGNIAQNCSTEFRPFLEPAMGAIRYVLVQRAKARAAAADADDAVTAGALQAVAMLAAAMGPALTRHMRDILDLMFMTGLNQALCDALQALVREVGQLQPAVQGRLLDTVSVILVGMPFRPQQQSLDDLERRMGTMSMHYAATPGGPVPAGAMTNGVSHASSGSAAEPTSLVVRAASNIPVTPDTLVLALRTLRTFDFSEENLSEFLRNEVLKYTVHSSAAVRSEAIHAAAHIVLSDPLYRSMAGAGAEVASEVVQRLVSAAVVDVDRDVRLMAAHMLEEAFVLDFHLCRAQNIQDLFLLMSDEVFEVRRTVLTVIGRLVKVNAAYVMPSLRRLIIQLQTELEHARGIREREECVQLLTVLVGAAGNWICPFVGNIFATILPRIDDAPPQLASKLLDTVAALARVGGSELVPYYDELLASIVRAVSDGTNAPKRMAALKALSSCASFCAMVIDPYTEYPQLFNILSAILKDNSDMEMRTEALRAVGALGAIDQHRFKDALSNTADGTSGGLGGGGAAPNGTPVGAAATTAVAALPAGAMQRKAGTAGRKTGAAGRKIDARRRRNRRRQGRVQPNVMTAFNSEKPVEALVGDIPSDACGIAFSSDEYYTTVAVNALLSILNDTADVASHQEAAQALTNMFAPLKAKAAPYIEHSLHAILAAMEVAPDSDTYVIFYIKRLHKLVETAHQLIRPHLSSLFKLFSTDALGSIQQQNESIDLLKALAEALVGDFGPHIAIVLPYLIAVIDRDASDARAPTENALSAIQVLSPSLEGYLFLVMPRLIALLDTTMNPRKIVEAALECIAALVTAVNCSSFASRIVLTLVRLLQSTSTPELQGAVVDVLCTLMEQLQDEFTLFMPTIEAAMGKRRGASTARYERNARMLFSGRLIPQERPRPVPQALSEAVQAASAPAHGPDGTARQDIDVMQLRRAWSAKQQATKDGWIRWLREFTCELLQQSPSNSLRACSSLASRHTRLGSDLFNAAFVSCWTMLPGQYQQEIIASLQSVASNRDVPADILQAILGLAEYMERDEKQIPIDLKLLGDYADRCHALAKELHYKEAEWTLEKNYETIKKLIELNQNLDLHDSAIGMLDYVRKEQEDIQESVDWYTRLQQWDKALVIYRRQETEGGLSRENTMGQVRCLFEMSDWTALVPLYERIWSGSDQQLQTASAGIGMSMAWATGDIDRMEFYLSALPSNSGDKSFCRALLAVYRNNFGDAAQYIDEARQAIDLDLSAQITESDSRGYSQMFQCQMLTELEEIITYKTSNDDTERQMNIVTTWRERLSGIQQDVSMWQRLLRLRSMVLRPILDLDTWIKYVNMSRKSGQLRIARDAIAQLLDDEAHYMEEINRGEMDAVPTKLQAQAHEYARLNAQMARQQQMSSGSVAGLLPTGPSASWEGRMRRFSSAGGASTNASLDMAIRLSQQPALVYMYLKYKWAANERREAFQMLQLFARDYAGKIGFDVHSPDAFAENIDARLLANLNGHADAASDGETVHLLARFYFKQAEWLSSVQQTVSLSREAQTKAGMGDAPYSRQAGHREENGRRRGRSSTLSGASAAAPRGNARASEDGRARQDAQFLYELNSERIGESILESYRAATVLDRKWYKAWHSLALRHYLETQWYENEHTAITEDIAERHVVPAVHGFFRAIQL
ncbi:phosphatidylinositol kinase- protein kinase tor1, partial [Coemansia biformis]